MTQIEGPDPEPCDDCETGLEFITNFEGRRLCRHCLKADVVRRGWDKLESWPPPVENERLENENTGPGGRVADDMKRRVLEAADALEEAGAIVTRPAEPPGDSRLF